MLSTWTAQPSPALSANRWELIFAELTTLSARSQQLIKLFPFSPKPGLPHLTHHRLLSPVVSSFPITLTQTHRDFLVGTIGPRRERQADRQTDRPTLWPVCHYNYGTSKSAEHRDRILPSDDLSIVHSRCSFAGHFYR